MGYMSCVGSCFGCGKIFTFNPLKVPSVRRTPQSPREPICRDCVERANPARIAKGLEPIVVAPDAYEAVNEHALPLD